MDWKRVVVYHALLKKYLQSESTSYDIFLTVVSDYLKIISVPLIALVGFNSYM